MTRKPKAKSARKRGGQIGNKNALRHGFYSKNFSAEEKKRLDVQEGIDISPEIILIRVMIDRLKDEIKFKEQTITDANGNILRDAHYLNQLNTLSAMTQSEASLIRTQYLIRGKSGDIQSSILAALEELRLEMGL